MKVIDLLNKIANGEEAPKIIEYKCTLYKYNKQGVNNDYIDEDEDSLFDVIFCDKESLNVEVEIIEEDKKIEKLYVRERANDFLIGKNEHICFGTESCVNRIIADKINEITDKLNEMSDKE